ncbi:MAG: thiamine pyrophosphate-dependent enzyme [Candidatus Pacearchaeota archaeon]
MINNISLETFPIIQRFPKKLNELEFYKIAYPYMYLSRKMEEKITELYRKGYVKGTVTQGIGNEAVAVGISIPFRPGYDPISILHRDFASHLVLGSSPFEVFNQYIANQESPTYAREGNVHWAKASEYRLPMISHLGNMLSVVVGATWQQRRNGFDSYGLGVVGDGGTSKGEFHESINLACVHQVPVLFIIENNFYSFSTPVEYQYTVKNLSERALGYNIKGLTIDGTNPWLVYSTVFDFLEEMKNSPSPKILECETLRFGGHAVYDSGDYLTEYYKQKCNDKDPIKFSRRRLMDLGIDENEISDLENKLEFEISQVLNKSLRVPRPNPKEHSWTVYAISNVKEVKPFQAKNIKNGDAVNKALDYILENNDQAVLIGLDIGIYGSAFKTCKKLYDKYGGRKRIIDMPLSESGYTGFALGASQTGARPIVEYQFADFSTEATTQMALNSATWFFRTGKSAPILFRLPCGGGISLGAFHSGEYEGFWSRFPGLKILYPATAQETFEALVAGFYDENPCIVFENKSTYWNKSSDIIFNGKLEEIWRPRNHLKGKDITIVAIGAMLYESLAAQTKTNYSLDIWNPFVIKPLDSYNILDPIIESVKNTGRLLVVQESQKSSGIGNDIISLISQKEINIYKTKPRLLASLDVPVPFAPELEKYYRPDTEKILEVIDEMMKE